MVGIPGNELARAVTFALLGAVFPGAPLHRAG